jgi:hypothetical protein
MMLFRYNCSLNLVAYQTELILLTGFLEKVLSL